MFGKIGSFFKKIWLICSTFCVKYAKITAKYVKEFFTRAWQNRFWLFMMITSFIIGLFLLIVKSNYVIDYLYIIMGSVVAVFGFTQIAKFKNGQLLNYYTGTLYVVLGVLLMFYHNLIAMIVIGLFFIGFPIYRIIKSLDKKNAIHQELLMIIIGVLTIFSGEIFAGAIVKILGVILILLTGYLGYLLWIMDESLARPKKVFVEEDKLIDVNEDEVILNEEEK